jgi:hypothetical protein
MKKFMIMLLGAMFSWHAAYAQSGVQTWTEDFDGTVSFSSTPANAWKTNSVYALSVPNSYLGVLPNLPGDSIILTTPVYDLTGMDYVILRFSHICKVSPQDTVQIQYRGVGLTNWVTLPGYAYQGKATNYTARGFSASSYTEWQAGDSLAFPQQSWWKEETFDLSADVNNGQFEFRFVIKHGLVAGTQVSYGWLLENFQLTAASHELYPPIVAFVSPLVRDTVYSVGVWDINAKVKTATHARIEQPYLKYTAVYNGSLVRTDSVLMLNVQGDSLWKASIPPFQAGTTVTYSVTGKDTTANQTTALSGYTIALPPTTGGQIGSVIIGTGSVTNNETPLSIYFQHNWSRQLYLASEIEPTSAGGLITHLAWDYGYALPWTVINQRCYMRAVDDTVVVSGYVDPPSAGANLVWQGTLSATGAGWVEIVLDKPFLLPQGKNLLVYWINENVTNINSTANLFRHTTTTLNRTVSAQRDAGGLPIDMAGTLTTARPNVRLYLHAIENDNSVASYSIDVPDTVVPHPINLTPIVMSFINRGGFNLTSATISYSVNGSAPTSKNWVGNLPWSFTAQDTIGSYYPSVNGRDTLLVWVQLPNGVTDNTIWDDTLRKIVYGSSEIVMAFVTTPADSVNNTGPFEVTARIGTRSGTPINAASLDVVTTYNMIATPSTVSMSFDSVTNLWKASIPQTRYNSSIVYSITLLDIVGNTVSISKNCFLKLNATDSNSVALLSIESPLSGGNTAGAPLPIQVRIRNAGIKDITGCDISWSLNGVLKSTHLYSNIGLPWDFTDIVTIDNYTFLLDQKDTFVVWVSNPNGVIDPTTNDDTVSRYTLGCPAGGMSGDYVIGSSGLAQIPTLAMAYDMLNECGMTGKVRFLLENGTYPETIDLASIANKMYAGNSFELTSVSGNAQDVIIQSTGVGIKLGNNRNIIIKDLTVDATNGTYGIQFTAACTNIVIRDCELVGKLIGTTAATAYAPIYKALGTGVADSIFIINNLLDGGYYGLCFYGGTDTTTYATHIVFDSNTVSNSYYYGGYFQYTDLTSCSYNSILSRQIGTIGVTWYGLYIYYSNGILVGNRIRQRSTTITIPYGIACQYYNYYVPNPNPNRGLIANNEIILNTTGAYFGINANTYTHANILHNSIYITGAGAARGINIVNSTENDMVIKNNNIALTSGSAFPLYLNAITNLNVYDMDYNNMYAPTYVGYAAANKANITAWQQTITTDRHSVRISPFFTNISTGLELSNYTGLHCTSTLLASSDILGVFRGGITTMGAYHGHTPLNGDAMLNDMTTLRTGAVSGQTDNIRVVVYNTGATPLTFVNLEWSVNGISHATGGTNYPVSLNYGDSTTITLGQLSYPAGTVEVRVWLNNLNNGILHDDDLANDTLQTSTYVCVPPLSGTYTIGTTGDYPSYDAVLNMITTCGIGGDVVFAFQPATYTQQFNFTNSATTFGTHKLKITSTTGNAQDVTFQSTAIGVTLNNSRNLTLEAITIDVINGTYGVRFTGTCTNIVIRDCRILANNSTTTQNTNVPIYKANLSGVTDSIFIINNLLDGGYYGFYFYGGTGSAAYGTHIVFDSNMLSNQYYYGVYAYYMDFISCSYNSILSRQSGTIGATWYGFNIMYCNGPIVCNRIRQRSTTIERPYGIACQYYNYYFPNPNPNKGLIANNEIMLNTTGVYSGINANTYTRANILHNSIYILGIGAARGINITNSTANDMVIKNNNIVLPSSAAFPLYLNAITNLNLYDIDYNNYYAPLYIGYAEGNITTMQDWQQVITTDQHSVSSLPNFVDTTSLELADYTDMYCYRLVNVPINIHGNARTVYTTMGAQGIGIADVYDMALSAITSPTNIGELCSPDYTPVRIELLNTGIVDHDFSTDPITVHFSVSAAPNIPAFDTLVLIDTGSLTIQRKLVIELMSSMDVSRLGDYYLTGWISNAKDTMPENDTLRTIYQNLRLRLPIDEDFSGSISIAFRVRADNTPAVWQQITQGIGTDTAVRPVFGTGMLSFVGSRGAMSTLSSQQIDLSGAVQPRLSFWYFHDTIPDLNDYTDVRITVDGGATYNTLLSLTKYDAVYGWKEYNVDLSSYANHSCVILSFEAMEKSPSEDVVQYIDRVRITALQDVAIREIIMPVLGACDLQNKEVKVVINTATNQAVDLSGSQLAIEIPNYSGSPITVAFPHTPLAGNAYDTITLPNLIDLDTGNYTIKAYITTPVDDNQGNDTAYYTVNIRPALSITVIASSELISPIDAGLSINQRVTITNTGNTPLSDIRLRLHVLVSGQPEVLVEETLEGITLAAGDSLSNYLFTHEYVVPWNPAYAIMVEAKGCDSAKIYAFGYTDEYVNTDDLALLRIDNPTDNGLDTISKQVYVKITLHNNSMVNYFQGVKATVELRLSDGILAGLPYGEAIPSDIPLAVDTSYTFTQAYTVPNDSTYTVTVFITDLYGNPIDHFRTNDTARVIRRTTGSIGISNIKEGTAISMEQNTPNPATGTTRIGYSIPTDGEVIFHVYTISGQELFNQVVETTSGKHSIELNTTSLASGIYFYSMEFKGQRIVKCMSVSM